jgi:hypothetical protein
VGYLEPPSVTVANSVVDEPVTLLLRPLPPNVDPFTFAPVKGMMTRYAKKMVNNRFYGVIKVKNIVKFGIESFR